MRAFIQRGLDLLFPSVCLVCRQDISRFLQQPICSSCVEKFPRCREKVSADGELIKNIEIPFLYENELRRFLWAYKFLGKDYLARWIVQFWKPHSYLDVYEIDAVVAVPSHPWRDLRRGYSPSLFLARAWAEELRKPLCRTVIKRRFFGRSQRKLNRKQRLMNASRLFRLAKSPQLKNKNILLIDDVYTTGATLVTCAALLKQAGAKSVMAACFAYDPINSQRS